MKSSVKLLVVVVGLVGAVGALAACPEERKQVTEEVGGKPKEQVDVAKERLNRAENKMQENAAAAAATE